MHEAAARKADEDPDRLSYVHAVRACTPVRVIRRKMAACAAFPPPQALNAYHEKVIDEILEERVVSSRGRRTPRAVKRTIGKWPIRQRVRAAPSRARGKPLYQVKVLK